MSTSQGRKRTRENLKSSADVSEVARSEPKRKKQRLDPQDRRADPKRIEKKKKKAPNRDVHGGFINMPPEIVLQIFEHLPRNDLLAASLVCSQWQQVSKDESILWCNLFNAGLVEDHTAYGNANDPALQKLLPEKSMFSYQQRDQKLLQAILVSDNVKMVHHVYDEDYNHCMQCMIMDGSDPAKIVPTRAAFSDFVPDFSLDFYRYSVKLFKYLTYSPGTVTVEFNPRRLETCLRKGEHSEATDKLSKYFSHQILKSLRDSVKELASFNSSTHYLPAALPILSEQPEELVGRKLHKYQLNALNWMLSTETSEKSYAVSQLFQIKHTNLHLLIDGKASLWVTKDKVNEHDYLIKPKGGVLADEMGLGKTITMIGLILTNPMKEPPVNKPYFTSKATLVFCPNHLVQQWKKEIETHCTKKLSIVVLTTIIQVKKYSYKDIMDADVVIVSYNLLQNKNYIAFPGNPKEFVVEKPSRYHPSGRIGLNHEARIADLTAFKRIKRVETLLEELKDKDPKAIKGVILDHFHWHRVIMDEGHELINDISIGRFSIIRLQKTYAWYMSGTPFPTTDNIRNARKLVGLVGPEPKKYEDNKHDEFWGFEEYYREDYRWENWCNSTDKPLTVKYFEDTLTKLFLENLVWRNTKASIVDEYKMVDVTDKYKILSLTEVERGIYQDLVTFPPIPAQDPENYYSKKPILNPEHKLCQELNEEWGDSLTEIRQYFIDKKKREIRAIEQDIVSLTDKREEALSSDDWEAKLFVKYFPDTIATRTKSIERCEEIKKIFEDAQPVNPSDDEDCLEAYIERHGTKLGNLVGLVKDVNKKNPSTGVIVFSRYSPYLRKIAKVLTEHDIPSSFVEGNVFSKTNAMMKFKNKEVRIKVILLNIEKSASGANLIEASHVVFMEPLEGDPGYIKATERQAIGRAQRQGQTEPVTVTRFLVKDTVEHRLYLKNYGTNGTTDTTISQTPSKGTLVRSGSFSVNIAEGQRENEKESESSSSSSGDFA